MRTCEFNHNGLCRLVERSVKIAFAVTMPEFSQPTRVSAAVVNTEGGDLISVHIASNAVNNMTEEGVIKWCDAVARAVLTYENDEAYERAGDYLYKNYCQVHEGGMNVYIPTAI